MKLLPVFIQVAGELGVGTTLFVLVQRTGEIRSSFFGFMSWLTAASFFLVAWAMEGSRFYGSVYFSAAMVAAAAGVLFNRERYQVGKLILLMSGLLAFYFLLNEVVYAPSKTGSTAFAVMNLVSGVFLFGWSNGSMILGHWYLVMHGLSFSHFQRATVQLLMATGLRTAVFGAGTWWMFFSGSVDLTTGPGVDMLYFWMRGVWGILLPAVFGVMAWRCALSGSNQAGTGLLYIAEVAVLIGEILAGFLGF